MIRILLIALLIPALIHGQIFSDTKDPFTGVRTVSTKPEKLIGSLVMTIGTWSEDSTGKKYYITIWSQGFSDISSSIPVGNEKGAWLISSDNKRYVGKWTNTFIMEPTAVLGRTASSVFEFSVQDVEGLTTSTITDFKMIGDKGHGYQMKLERGRQKVFKSICQNLLSVK